MPRAFHLHGVLFLLAAFTLLFFTALSLPFIPPLDLVRVHFGGVPSIGYGGQASLTELRFGTWGYCWYESTGARFCSSASHAYMVTVYNADKSRFQFLAPPFTRGLAVHPTAVGLTFCALLLSLFTNTIIALLVVLLTLLASLFAIACIIVDLVLYTGIKHRMENLDGSIQDTRLGTGFWMVVASFILLCLAGFTVCFGRRRDRMSGATSYPLTHHKKPSNWRARFPL
ncbi:hypothetical protein BDY19DRAFT_952611 [Irpex rosettiformis]|uniref:Uncharacterized protein n=1 Tax=Irpex rosettiformis TaxID=378272 RepID=A0ACB8U013_9APHY|nr:hypothetical protein BDY19DRAFT_952611 [Irpex rosettiformis]